jgi:antitoxin component of RelBE/YafQ-DinJ toxin-antitoxin module
MKTKKKGNQSQKDRISIQLEPDVKQAYLATAQLMGMPTSRFMSLMLTQAVPTIIAMQKPLKTVLSGKEEALAQMNEIQQDLLKGIEK